ncbi:MAG TPA: hypothetical protein VI935_01090 [Thermodesulfobacteriota bacterium]|nr:hypothetical protein [Thermodesulfobacteriota bacterium]
MTLVTSILSLENISITAKMLLIVLHCNTDSEEKCWLSDYEIARLLAMHPKSIQKVLGELVRRKLIARVYDELRRRYIIPQGYEWETPLELQVGPQQ